MSINVCNYIYSSTGDSTSAAPHTRFKKALFNVSSFSFEQVIDFAKRYMYVIFSEGDLMEM